MKDRRLLRLKGGRLTHRSGVLVAAVEVYDRPDMVRWLGSAERSGTRGRRKKV